MDMVSAGILIARLFIGFAMIAHGVQKLFGWFGGPGLKGASGMMESMGFKPGKPFALAACAAEIGGGLLCFFGLGGPIGPTLIIMIMVVGAGAYHLKNGFFSQNGGYELNLAYIVICVVIMLNGNGMHSLDHALEIEWLYSSAFTYISLAIGIVLAAVNLASRRPDSLD